MSKRVIITGGAGFIGSALTRRLIESEFDVFVLDNLSFGNRNFIEIKGHNWFIEDIRNAFEVKRIFKEIQPEIVIHLAAIHYIPYCNLHPYEAADVNIRGTMNVLVACKESKNLEKIFFASTAAVYPVFDGSLNENHFCEPVDIYGLSKLTGEQLVHRHFLELQVPTIICRFFNAFGPNETNPHLIPAIQDQINKGNRTLKLGNLEPKRDYIHTYDMAEAVTLLLEKFDKGFDIFNLGSGKEYSVKEIVDAFGEALGEQLQIEQDPSRMRKSDRMHLQANIDKLRSFIPWQPRIGIKEGIKTLIEKRVIV